MDQRHFEEPSISEMTEYSVRRGRCPAMVAAAQFSRARTVARVSQARIVQGRATF